ncbi:MAG: glycosyltransferase family 2 protein [Syntrophomonas sp.]|uniref:glycosyltransferase n=1 Tax=Syntrophomonas sp. TaxID=2053627 RepID=UPI0026348B99|nr:glycosyltransferase family 2 protein [Syntrophomonas sp.]MDD2511151.1 glycosyltransferase family 2 protein [Syntrophomonas sp.]MDD3879971.1 glycosyltransferase family 2 protein [Syntrophomonas sp.]MDD4626407.1 glycosyltransferase family 2 protein [Syntrophomonas sp.]
MKTCRLSIIIPTYNERDNVLRIAEHIGSTLKSSYEIVFVDDSNDDTPEILQHLSKSDPHVRFEHRHNERGLGTAVVRGFEIASGDVIAVMDADLQHPPEVLLSMLKAIESGADIVIPSRFIPGGNDGGLKLHRKIVSATARYIGKALIKKLRPISDSTSGFFMFRKDVIKEAELQPIGWKILIEVLARGKYTRVIEIPYQFQARAAGESKMSVQEQWNYIRHLMSLVKDSPEDRRFFYFSLVGLSGVFVNMSIYFFLTMLNLEVRIAGFCSAFVAMLVNFVLNDKITWANVKTNSVWSRGSKYIITSLIGIGINVGVLDFFYYQLQFNHLLSNLIGISCAVFWNYTINNLWTWSTAKHNKTIIIERWTMRESLVEKTGSKCQYF